MTTFDSAVVLSGVTGERSSAGDHGPAIAAAMREVLGPYADVSPDTHRHATKQLVIEGEVTVPFGTGWTLASIRELDVVLAPGAQVNGYGKMPAPLTIDGCSYGRFDATRGSVGCRRPDAGGRHDVPWCGVVLQQSRGPQSPNLTHFSFTGKIGGVWRYLGYSGGTPDRAADGSEQWNSHQEDHLTSPLIQIFGSYYDLFGGAGDLSAGTDLCRYGGQGGALSFGNNRRHYYGTVHVAWCETAWRSLRTAVTIDRLIADGCRDYYEHNAARMVINGGEAESCARIVNDGGWSGHDFPLVMRDVKASLDAWDRGLAGVGEAYRDTAFGVWGTRGNCRFENCSIGGLPVVRGGDGVLRHRDGGPRPRLWSAQPTANVFFDPMSDVHGYKRGEERAHEPQGTGAFRYEVGWKDTDPDGFVRRTMLDAANMRAST